MVYRSVLCCTNVERQPPKIGGNVDDDELWDMKTVSEYLGVGRGTLTRWRQTGYGPTSIKLGRGVRYRRIDVEKWLRDKEEK